MNLSNSKRVMKKDWKTIVRNKEILLPMILIPLLFTVVMPLLTLIGVRAGPEDFINSIGNKSEYMRVLSIPSNYNDYLVAAVIITKAFILPYFLFTPTLTSVIISSDSFAGEKERKTMESLVLLPISKTELIVGKVLSAFVPSILLSFFYFGILGLITNLVLLEFLEGNILIFTDLSWILLIFLFTPVLSFFNILITTIVSSRAKNFKNAQSISGLLILPVLALLFTQIFNPAFLNPVSILILTGIIFLICLLFLRIGNKLLDIERLILML